ncbi:cytochrome C assembly family protein [Porticoccus sp. GXU_MW_L64]
MSTLYAGYGAIALYIFAFFYQAQKVRAASHSNSSSPLHKGWLLAMCALAIATHGFTAWQLLASANGLDLSLWRVSAAIFFVVNLIVLLSSLRKPSHNLFLFLLPITIPVLAIALVSSAGSTQSQPGTGTTVHILSSILAYSLLTIAAFQAMLLAYQNWQLRHKHLKGWVRALPPLETMEALLFEVLWAGVILLSLALLSGFLVFEDLFAQNLGHKTVFSLAAWAIYAVLLWGRHVKGWRGNTAIRWTLIGFIATALAYWGSKFVYEVLLG